jgi:hydroxyacylglutathione hydrolase
MIVNNKNLFFCTVTVFLSCCNTSNNITNLQKISWIHGSADCRKNTDLPIQVEKVNDVTWILRQNKCINYEAPFMFLFIGKKRALLMDTGATEDDVSFPLYKTIKKILEAWERKENIKLELIVAHTHAHSDHVAADSQFTGKPNTVVVGKKVDDVASFFAITNWPQSHGQIDLGERIIDIIPIPGHEKSSIALYDYKTKILLSGDSFYPGRLYVQDWEAYRSSIKRLTDFATRNPVSYVLGNHIEMTKISGQDYPAGTLFQPNEQILPLKTKDLMLLNDTLQQLDKDKKRVVFNKFIVTPVN